MPEMIRTLEAARLELRNAWERRHRAERELAAFLARHDGQRIRRDDRAAFDREQHLLEVELDEAIRAHAAAKKQFALEQQKLANTGNG